jgi:shikimate kinase
MAVVLVTGMSGAGKSTVLTELGRRGHAVVDTDHGGYIEDVRLPGRPDPEPLWREDRMAALLDAHAGGHLFIAGTVANQGRFYPRFDAVVLLTAPLDVLLDRLATRTSNDFGKRAAERARVVRDAADVEPLLRQRATLEVDTRRPLPDVVDAVLTAGDPLT